MWLKMKNFIFKISRIIPDKLYLNLMYYKHFRKWIDFKKPTTFNEKLQWLKLNHRKLEATQCVDKYLVKAYVADKLGEAYIIPTLGVWDTFDAINFDSLPNQFVLKCNHDSGSIVICKDKKQFDKEAARQKLTKGLKRSGYWYGREWPYKDVQPKIIAEQYMEDTLTSDLRDYKFFCFNGKVKCFKVDFDRYEKHGANYYDTNSMLLPFGEVCCPPDPTKHIAIPESIGQMMAFAECLASDTPFVRVDFYVVNGAIYFGELTFYPASGLGKFTSSEWDIVLGEWLALPVPTHTAQMTGEA